MGNNRHEVFEGRNSSCPEYQKVFNGEPVSVNRLREENPNMVIALNQIVKGKQHYGQMTLEGDIIYPPLFNATTLDVPKIDRFMQGNDTFPPLPTEDAEGLSYLRGHKRPVSAGVNLVPIFHHEPE